MTVRTPAELQAQYVATLPDNISGDISPADTRDNFEDTTDSWDALKLNEADVGVPQFNADQLQGEDISTNSPTDGQILIFDEGSGEWVPGNAAISVGLIGLVDNAVVTTISTIDTPVKIDPAAFTSHELTNFVQSTNGRLTYTGTATKDFFVLANVSLSAGANNKDMTIYIAKNGSIDNDTKSSNITLSGSPTETSIMFILSLATNDFLELFVENNTDTNDITAAHTRLMAKTL